MAFVIEDEDCNACPMCGGQGMPFGALGNREHFRCRQCGMTYSVKATDLSAGLCPGCGFAYDDAGGCRCKVIDCSCSRGGSAAFCECNAAIN